MLCRNQMQLIGKPLVMAQSKGTSIKRTIKNMSSPLIDPNNLKKKKKKKR